MRQHIQIVQEADKRSGPFARIEDAIAAIRSGKMVIVVDDEDRENEGDLTIAAEKSRLTMSTLWRGTLADWSAWR